MFAWAKVILLFLQLVDKVYDFAVKQGYVKQGRDEVIAEIAMKIAARAASKKAIQEKVDAMSEDEVDADLRGLEPK